MGGAMQVSGRLIILVTVGFGFLMAGGAWWYRYQESQRAAAFWGEDVGLLTTAPKVELLELGGGPEGSAEGEQLAGRSVAKSIDLSEKPGLIHLRWVFAEDVNFQWDGQQREA